MAERKGPDPYVGGRRHCVRLGILYLYQLSRYAVVDRDYPGLRIRLCEKDTAVCHFLEGRPLLWHRGNRGRFPFNAAFPAASCRFLGTCCEPVGIQDSASLADSAIERLQDRDDVRQLGRPKLAAQFAGASTALRS